MDPPFRSLLSNKEVDTTYLKIFVANLPWTAKSGDVRYFFDKNNLWFWTELQTAGKAGFKKIKVNIGSSLRLPPFPSQLTPKPFSMMGEQENIAYKFFRKFGEIREATVIYSHAGDRPKSKGYGFVIFQADFLSKIQRICKQLPKLSSTNMPLIPVRVY